MLSLFTFPVITAILEPYFQKTALDPVHIFLGLLVLLGIFIMSPELNYESDYFKGIVLGILSATCYALRTLVLKRHVGSYNGTVLMVYQVGILSVILIPSIIFTDWMVVRAQYPYILLIALLTTAIGHTMFIQSLNYFKVSTASIIASAQPLFGIILALLFLNEIPKLNTIIGGGLIILTVLIESLRSGKTKMS